MSIQVKGPGLGALLPAASWQNRLLMDIWWLGGFRLLSRLG